MSVHLIKLSVGTDSVEDLAAWQAVRIEQTGQAPRHVTRMWPKREAELLDGGSIYWVIKGQIQARQKVVALEEVDRGDGIRRCAIVLDPTIYRVAPSQRRPFQGWRYLKPEDAPRDLSAARKSDDSLPPELDAALAEIGVI
ncbi:hypothetical protein PSM7751_00447 [Pseudooceanicola marinus]|uniref:Lysophospholipase n=1 Tax=Pseudooceanicola marinus TaxID=396013 RepID=A0A1X6YAM0_9RHOB|nr:DUF1489 domain-containing protein [Pseudooceanicola marinus]SLN15878.1 hypothetical protein PSM7751_00447 [Pseudooceanicola marinus]